MPYFVHNEFLDDDVNRWTTLARDRLGVRTLAEATAGKLETSPRFRDVFQPLGLGDELRAVFRVAGICWGCMCLHRVVGAGFSKEEAEFVRRLAPHIAEGIRAGLLVRSLEFPDVADAPGLVVMGADGSVISTTVAGERWLEEFGHREPERTGVPGELRMLAAMLDRPDTVDREFPRLRVRTPGGRWAVLHGSRMTTQDTHGIAVIIEEASPVELASVLMMAYGLTRQEQVVTGLICHGLTTREIADRLHITSNTIQDHLKSIFDKTGVRSRRELAISLLQHHYLPRAMRGQPIGPSGFFVE